MKFVFNLMNFALMLLLSSCTAHVKVISEIDTIPEEPKIVVGMRQNLELLKAADHTFRSGK